MALPKDASQVRCDPGQLDELTPDHGAQKLYANKFLYRRVSAVKRIGPRVVFATASRQGGVGNRCGCTSRFASENGSSSVSPRFAAGAK